MKSYLSLVPISSKVHGRQSRMTRICIILAVFLVTSIFSMAEMWNESELTAMRRNHGDWHIALQNLPEEKVQQIMKNSDIAFSSWYDEINADTDQGYYIGGKNVVLYGIEERYVTDIMNYPSEGSYPQTESEVALSMDAKELFGSKIGDRVILKTPEGDFEYTISGFYEDDKEFNDMIQGCCVYMNRTSFDEICSTNGVEEDSQFYIRFQKENGLKKTIENLKVQYHLTDEQVSENTAVLGFLGASSSETFNWLYPLVAVSGNAGETKKLVRAANTRLFKVETSLGVYHATGRKKNLFLMTGSFALTIVLFLTFSACLDVVNKLLPSAVSKFTPDITIASENDTNSIDGNLLKEIEQIEGVDWAFGFGLYASYPVEINGNEGTIDLFSHDKALLDKFKNSVVSGDIEKVYGDGNYAMAVYNQSNHLSVGDKIKIGNQELEIACVASEGIGSVSNAPTVVCSEETFTRLTGDCGFVTIGVVLKKDVSETAVKKIANLANGNLFSDNREVNSENSGSYWVFRIAAYGFLTIISLITVLNIMNSISMGVSARVKQYGAMRAAGMENRQVTKMITAEAVTYAVCGMIVGIVFGLMLHYLIYAKIVITHFGGSWNIPFSTIGIVFLLVTFSCIISVHGPAKRMRNMAITDTINDL